MSLTKILKDLKQWKKVCSVLLFCETYHHKRKYMYDTRLKKIYRVKRLKNGNYIKITLTMSEKMDAWHYVGMPYRYTKRLPKQKKLYIYRGTCKD